MPHLLIFGHGYSGQAIARAARNAGWQVTATTRTPQPAPSGVALIPFADAAIPLATATHAVATAAPAPDSTDPILAAHAATLSAAPALRWLGYLSTTGVYGDHRGAWVDEATPPTPQADRSVRRLAAEQHWRDHTNNGTRPPLDILRLAGIYGPGRSAIDDLRANTARRIVAPDHAFGRIHIDDIAGAVLAAATHPPTAARILNLSDDAPTPSATVIEYAATLLGIPPPPARTLAEAWPTMSAMARSFWSDNRRVASAATQAALHRPWRHPTYREGLAAILAAEQQPGDQPHHQPQV